LVVQLNGDDFNVLKEALDYFDRGTLLDQIYKKLSVLASRAALLGLGGVSTIQKAWGLIRVLIYA
jgi:hypothetical protein